MRHVQLNLHQVEGGGSGKTQVGGVRSDERADAARLQRLTAEIEHLGNLDFGDMRTRYRQLFRKAAPPHLPRWLLARVVAYRAQADVLGDLDRETLRYLDRIAKDRAVSANAPVEAGSTGSRPGRPRSSAPGGVPPVPSRLRHGTQLVREHEGELHRVTVLDAGFSWEGRVFTSLSEVARAITGTIWNGPAFFGLRPSKRAKGDAVVEPAAVAGGSP